MRLPLPGIRWQLTLWFAASVLAILLLAGGIFTVAFKVTMDAQVDRVLQGQSQQIATTTTLSNGRWSFATPPDAISPWSRVLNGQGQVIFTAPALVGVLLAPASVQVPLAGGVWQDTVRLATIHLVRFAAYPLYEHGLISGVVQVGQPLDLVTEPAGLSAVTLAFLLPFVVAVSLGGSYWLAGRALAPVRRLSRLANAVQDSGDLRQRVPVPAAHDEIRALAETLNAMLARLEAAFAAQRRFVADASHDLRTPIAALLSLAENARDGIDPRPPTQSLAIIAEQAQRLRRLITNLFQLARADEGRLPGDCEAIQVDLLVCDAAVSLLPLADERSIALQAGHLDAVVIQGDVAQLLLVVMNLVDNALTYTPPGGTITLSVHRAAERVLLTVQDTGIGIAAEDLPHIFERFYRTDRARQHTSGGSGLGLAIVRTLVEAHQGTVNVSSSAGQGTIVVVDLPLLITPQQGGI